jgi:hypothetical protein
MGGFFLYVMPQFFGIFYVLTLKTKTGRNSFTSKKGDGYAKTLRF